MSDTEIYERLNGIFRDFLEEDSINLRHDMTADDVEGWDSVTHVNLLVAVEIEFGIKNRTDEIESFKNVGDMVALIRKKVA